MYEKLEEYIDNLFEDDNTPKNQLKDWAYGAIDLPRWCWSHQPRRVTH